MNEINEPLVFHDAPPPPKMRRVDKAKDALSACPGKWAVVSTLALRNTADTIVRELHRAGLDAVIRTNPYGSFDVWASYPATTQGPTTDRSFLGVSVPQLFRDGDTT